MGSSVGIFLFLKGRLVGFVPRLVSLGFSEGAPASTHHIKQSTL
ncbi:hypothetical protein HMPREF0044_0154 [Gleimia coleocanis DSM 15436]|uniref:Uncharacterized protein n=1 Tax=Gleimia coleocanis DSM 15436 TaxID=525245 RepID=C0VYB4_9ACTO|nr:hypothetical protein HMPREF0044_0154 [Gleimia coleocanis DSM 15436]